MSEILKLLKDLVSRPSVTPHDAGCQAHLAERLAAAGFALTPMQAGDVHNLWATHGSGRPLVCLAGHTDVVPAGPLAAWNSEPFEPTEVEGRLIGRGAADMKASVAAMTVALERIARGDHPGTIALLLTSDEEGPGVDGTRYVLDTLTRSGIRIDAAIVGEPTSERVFGDTIKSGRRGSMNGRLVIRGRQGHTAYPQLADNAVHRLAPALASLVSLDWGAGTADFPPTTLQISNVSGGTGAGNVIPGEAEARFNLRFGTDWTVGDIQDRVARTLSQAGIDAPVEWEVSALPFLTSSETLLQAICGAVRELLETNPTASTGGGTSDARFFAAHGIPVIEFGPLNATIHAANEGVEIDCLEPLAGVYERAVRTLLESSQPIADRE